MSEPLSMDDLLRFEDTGDGDEPEITAIHEQPPYVGLESDPRIVRVTDILPNAWNPHRMTEQEQTDLEASVREDGQWRPVLVVELDQLDETLDDPDAELPDYRIVDGEHLFHAITSLYLAGQHDGDVRVLVLGKNSEVPLWKQMEIGQTINHGLRGSEEDPDKTKRVINHLLRHRRPEVIAQRMGLGLEGVKHLARPVDTPSRGTPAQLRPKPGPKAPGGSTGLGGAVGTTNEDRKSYTIALVFDESDQLKSFEERVAQAADALGLERSGFVGRNGQYRIEVLTQALETLLEGPAEEAFDD